MAVRFFIQKVWQKVGMTEIPLWERHRCLVAVLLFWTVRPGDRTDNQYGELVEQAGQANPIRKLWLLAIAAVVIPLVLMMMAGVALIGMTWLGYSPATEVVEGAE